MHKVIEYFNKKSNNFLIGVVGLLTLIVYQDIFFGHEFLLYDDSWYIYDNKNVTNFSWSSIVKMFSGPLSGQYSPIGELYHSILYHFFGKEAIAFKFFSLVVHFLNSILVFKIINKISENRLLAIFVTLVFSLHPMQVETVAWISAIYRIAAFFMLLGYLFYLKYLNEGFKWKHLTLVIVFFILGLFTKEQAILFPIGLVLINLKKDYALFEKRIILENIFFAIIVLIFGLITIEFTKTGGPDIISNNASLVQKIYLFIDTFFEYLGNFLWPFGLSFFNSYPRDIHEWSLANRFFEVILFVIILILIAISCYKNKNLKFGILWGLGFLSLALSFSFLHMRDVFMADRYIYMAIIGFAFTLFYVFQSLKRMFRKDNNMHLILSFGFLCIITFSSYKRVPVFKNPKTLWSNAIDVNHKNAYAYYFMGIYYRVSESDLDKALSYYLKTIKYRPDYYLAHSDIGKVYYDQKKYQDALKHINRALELRPDFTKGYSNRVAVNSDLNRHEDAIKDLDYLLTKQPSSVKFLMNRAISYFKMRNFEKSLEDCKKILSIRDHEYAFYLLGHSQFLLQQYKAAEENLTRAIAMDNQKGNYYFFRSHSRLSLGKFNLAYEDVLNAQKYKHPVSQSFFDKVTNLAQK